MTKRGFTLIELLAVILILGIIALIAIPVVNKIIEQSRKGTFQTSTTNLVKSMEDECQLQLLKSEILTTKYTFSDGEVSPSLDVKGKLPTTGIATVDSSCNVKINVTNGKYTATKAPEADSLEVIKGAIYADGTAVYFNPETGSKCPSSEAISTTGTKTGCMKWYTFGDVGADTKTINLILDHNTTATVAWNSTGSNVNGPTNILTQLASDTGTWNGVSTRNDSYSVNNGTAVYTINYNTYKARLITAQEIATITGNISFANSVLTSAISSNWFFFDSNNQTLTAIYAGTSNYSWLYDHTKGCTNFGCNLDDDYTYGYWTSTSVFDTSINVWTIYRGGVLDTSNTLTASVKGVRPVITISKSNL